MGPYFLPGIFNLSRLFKVKKQLKPSIKVYQHQVETKSYIQVFDDGMIRINLQNSPPSHELQACCVPESLCFHQPAKDEKGSLTSMQTTYDKTHLVVITNLSILADHPNLPETSTHGDVLRRLETWTFATLSPSCCFTQSQRRLYSCLVFSFSLTSSSSSSPVTRYYVKRNYGSQNCHKKSESE